MKRQKTELVSRVYSYGSVPARVAPVLAEDLGLAQMRLGNRLWNVLVRIDRIRTEHYRRTMHDEVQERIDGLRAEADALSAEMRERRKIARRKTDVADLRAKLDGIKADIAPLCRHQQDTKQLRHDARREQLDAIQARANHRIKRARQAAASLGLYWGTYNDIVQRADAGRKHGGELRFRGFRGEGTLTAQIMGGAATAECVGGGHSFFRIDDPDGNRWRYARVRIGSNEDRSPKWLSVPIIYHRDIPEYAQIKSVSATRRIVAGKPRWQVNVTVNLPAPARIARTSNRMVAIDIGWRLLPEGVRVAYWQDDVGAHGQVLVASTDIAQFAKIKDLRSICDRSRDEFLPRLVAWLAGRTLDDDWTQETPYIAQWRSPDRLARLVRWWSEHRLAGDEEIHQVAVEWRKQYLHLADWWRNLQDQLPLRVREIYRVFAARVAQTYDTLVLEDFDLRDVAQPQEDAAERGVGTYRQMVSPSVFRAALVNASKREGVEVRVVSGAYTTATCHACGQAETWDQAVSVIHRCGQCGMLWDQDHNAALNLLASGRAMPTKDQGDTGSDTLPPVDRSQNGAQGVAREGLAG